MFNKTKPNIKDFYHEESLNNCVNYLIKLSQVPHTRSSWNNRKDKKCTILNSLPRGTEKESYIMKSSTGLMISWFGMKMIKQK